MTRWLITGGAGFIGSHLCERLLERGDSVAVVDDFSTGSANNLKNIRHRLLLVKVDVRNPHLAALAADADHIIHLAAVVGVQRVLSAPTEMLSVNLEGTANVLRVAHWYDKPVFIASTSEVYGRSVDTPFRESAATAIGPSTIGRWGYAVTKLADEFLALAHHKEHGLPVRVARLFNTVGPRQSALYGMVLPRFVEAALAGRPLQVYGDGSQTRCFCHVHDTVDAILAICASERTIGQVLNVGSDEEISVQRLAESIVEWTGSSSTIEHVSYESLGPDFEDMARRVPDTSQLSSLVDWKPTKSLRDIVLDVAAHIGGPR